MNAQDIYSYIDRRLCGISRRITTLTNSQTAPMTNNVSAASTMDFGTTSGYYTFTGTTATWRLPVLEGNTGLRFVIINEGTGGLTIISNSGGNDISDVGIDVSAVIVDPGTTLVSYHNSLKYTTIQ